MSSTLTDLTAATTWSGTDLFYALVGGNSRKIAAAKFLVAETSSSLAMQDSTTAQTFRVYRTFTDSSNYERLALQSGSGYFELAAETAGTGTDNLDLYLTPAGTGKINVQTSSDTSDGFSVTNSASSGGNLTAGRYWATGLTAGGTISISIGKANSVGNVASLTYKWWASNDSGNAISLSHAGGPTLQLLNSGQVYCFQELSVPAGGSTAARLVFTATANFGIYVGSGAPSVAAAQGSLYLRSDGSSNVTRMYVNTNGSTTWTAVNTVA